MDQRNEIIDQFNAFQQFLDGIDIQDLAKLSRNELTEFKSKLTEIKLRSFTYELSQLIDKKKVEEYPELLGVHHYPELKEINFMSDAKKLELDKHLAMLRVGNYINRLYSYAGDNVAMLEAFLMEKGIAEQYFIVLCPHCADGHLSSPMLKATLDNLVDEINMAESDEVFENLEAEGKLESNCSECEDQVDLTILKDRGLQTKKYMKLAKPRDRRLDNV